LPNKAFIEPLLSQLQNKPPKFDTYIKVILKITFLFEPFFSALPNPVGAQNVVFA